MDRPTCEKLALYLRRKVPLKPDADPRNQLILNFAAEVIEAHDILCRELEGALERKPKLPGGW